MAEGDWILAFDASQRAGTNWMLAVAVAIGVAALLVIAGLFVMESRRAPGRAGTGALAVLLFLGTAVVAGVSAMWFRESLGEEATARAITSSPMVEGVVVNFRPGEKLESFDVNGVHFAYSDYQATQGFNRQSTHGGPIRAGQYVRIRYVYAGNAPERAATIVRLEIRR